MLIMLGFAACGAIASWLGKKLRSSTLKPVPASSNLSEAPFNRGQKLLFAALLAWVAFHFAFMAVEVFTQPVYPWDAWTTWIYRSKAWFFSGGIAEMVSPAQWAVTTTANSYTGQAWAYPYFPSVIPFWSALSLGRWSETLVNLPVLLAGAAIAMAFYGQCREYGMSILYSLAGCYLLISIPLFGTHIALAGYADIWMAGFAGLGFIAIMRGSIEKSGFQTLLGFLMISLGMLMKFEGVVWFIAALFLNVLVLGRLRMHLLAPAVIGVAIAISFSLGIQSVEIPLAGTLGMENGRMHIPFVGSFVIEAQNVWNAYWKHFFSLGSWSLLWLLVLTAVIGATKFPWGSRSCPEMRVSLSFIILFLAMQAFIFGFTDKSAWASSSTAINRLPLQFIPAVLFAAIMIFHSRLTQMEQANSHA
jgi:hypothetical protein